MCDIRLFIRRYNSYVTLFSPFLVFFFSKKKNTFALRALVHLLMPFEWYTSISCSAHNHSIPLRLQVCAFFFLSSCSATIYYSIFETDVFLLLFSFVLCRAMVQLACMYIKSKRNNVLLQWTHNFYNYFFKGKKYKQKNHTFYY